VSAAGRRAAEEKMREAGAPDVAVRTFSHYHGLLDAGESGLMPDAGLRPPGDVPAAEDLDAGEAPLDRAVVLKLNGGLGTSMGMQRAKSLLEVREGLTFLDVIVRQTAALHERASARVPLVLMDSFSTQADSLAALEAHPELVQDVPRDFLQNKEPKLRADDLAPVEWPDRPELEWCPPGHGDLYTALETSGMLATLLERGITHAFVSNSDNLGAVLEPGILAWIVREEIPFLMEVCPRTAADRKGGHLAARADDGRLVLRESAQTPPEDVDSFQDTERWTWFNTNNLWVDLRALAAALGERDGVLGLPMIVNRKTVDPGDPGSPEVVQIETAMGAAIAAFSGARALEVARGRFAPVKTTNDLLVLRSDAYRLGEDGRVERVGGPDRVDLDPDHYKLVDDFEARFPEGPPSLRECSSLVVRGDVAFGAGVVCRGDVELEGPARIEPGAELSG
jgi:UTP--glucose-1-phosphate uridylyltransferase